MTIYEFILENSTYGKELFESKELMLHIRKMSDEDKLIFLKDYDKKRKPKRKKVDKSTNKKYTNKTNGGKSEAKSVPRKRKRKTTSKSTSD